MYKIFIAIFLSAMIFMACEKKEAEIETKINIQEVDKMQDNTPKVTGIGGIFFKSKDPEKSREWYKDHLGLPMNQWGASFESRKTDEPDKVNFLQWTLFEDKTEYFDPSEKEFMINYTVQNIEGLIEQLKEKGVTIVDTLETYDYGKFIHIMDNEGNKIELWEPVREVRPINDSDSTK